MIQEHIKCTNSEIGQLLTYYELDLLDERKQAMFEEHLFTCEFCLAEFKAGHALSRSLREDRERIAEILRKTDSDYAAEVSKIQVVRPAAHPSPGIVEKVKGFLDRYTFHWAVVPSIAVAAVAFLILLQSPNGKIGINGDDAKLHMRGGKSEGIGKGSITKGVDALLPSTPIRYDETLLHEKSLSTLSDFAEAMKSYSAGDYQTAITLLEKLAVSRANSYDLQVYLGSANYMSGSLERAVENFSDAARISNGGSAELRLYYASALIKLGRAAEAKGVLESIDPQQGEFYGKAKEILGTLN
ncbi:MAG: tetratricopeptide repeat protein [Calditrichaeota bacterium]|nr:tetratricopeptide repeat protein [Calditrichota bacterium]MCB9367631.1 tetratricopeptide repeat protein [Calditrichota bacterium]